MLNRWISLAVTGHATVLDHPPPPPIWPRPLALTLVYGTLISLLLFCNYRLWWTDNDGMQRIERLRADISLQQDENQRLLARNKIVEQEIASLRAGTDAIEERARSELGLIREGETYYHVIEDAKK